MIYGYQNYKVRINNCSNPSNYHTRITNTSEACRSRPAAAFKPTSAAKKERKTTFCGGIYSPLTLSSTTSHMALTRQPWHRNTSIHVRIYAEIDRPTDRQPPAQRPLIRLRLGGLTTTPTRTTPPPTDSDRERGSESDCRPGSRGMGTRRGARQPRRAAGAGLPRRTRTVSGARSRIIARAAGRWLRGQCGLDRRDGLGP